MNIRSNIRVSTLLALITAVSVLLFLPALSDSARAQSVETVEPSAQDVETAAAPDDEEIRGLILAAVPNTISDGGTVSLLAGVSSGTNIKWTWEFGDGSPAIAKIGTGQSNLQKHTFQLSNPSVPQTFLVRVNASNGNNLRGTTVETTVNVQVKGPSNLRISYAPNRPAAQQAIQFSAQIDSAADVVYKWEFGDGTVIENGPVVSHTYKTQGLFKFKVTASNNGGTVTFEERIAVEDSPLTYCQILVEGNSTVNNPLTITARHDGTNVNYNWILDDGTSNVNQSFTHAYAVPRVYAVRLTCNNNNNSISAQRNLIIRNRAPTSVTILSDEPFDTPILVDTPIFFGVFAGGGTNVTYEWSFGDGRRHVTQDASINHKYTKTGVYTVNVVATNDQGSGSSTRSIYVVNSNGPIVALNNGLTLTHSQSPAQFYPHITTGIPVRLELKHDGVAAGSTWWQNIDANDIRVEWTIGGTVLQDATASSSLEIPVLGDRRKTVMYDSPGKYLETAVVRVKSSESPDRWVIVAQVETIVSVGGRLQVPFIVR